MYTRTSPLHLNININTHVMMCLMEEERSYVMKRLILDRLIFNSFGTYHIRTYHSGVEVEVEVEVEVSSCPSVASVRRVSPECRTCDLRRIWSDIPVFIELRV